MLLPHRSDRDVFSSPTNLLRGTGPVKGALEKGLGSATFFGRFRRFLAKNGGGQVERYLQAGLSSWRTPSVLVNCVRVPQPAWMHR